MALCTLLRFHPMMAFTLIWRAIERHFSRKRMLPFQLSGIRLFGLGIPISAQLTDRHGRRGHWWP